MFRYIKLYILLLIITNTTFAQKIITDTTYIYLDDDDAQFDISDSAMINNRYISEDMIFVPSALLYNHKWDNKNIRLRKVDISGIKDTTFILFNTSPENNFYFPIKGKLISPFGYRGRRFHTGVDIKLMHNDSVNAVMAGKVRIARRYKGYGNVVVLRHFNGLETVYAHLNKICVNDNQELNAGDLVGLGGRTGHATCDHLHFEVRFLEQPINPLLFMDFENYKLKQDTLIMTAISFKDYAKAPNKSSKSKHKGKKTPVRKTTVLNKSIKQNADSNADTGKEVIASISPGSKKYHTIRSGDNLYNIALRNKTTVNKLCELNGISKKKILKLGTKIRIH